MEQYSRQFNHARHARAMHLANAIPLLDGSIPEGWLLNIVSQNGKSMQMIDSVCFWWCGQHKVDVPMKCVLYRKEIAKQNADLAELLSWHAKCIKSFFGTNALPQLDISTEKLRELDDKYKGSYERCAKIINWHFRNPNIVISELYLRIVF